MPVAFDVVDMHNYSGQTQQMEMRKPAFGAGTRVLLVDQWIETGGTMNAGVSLVERQGGLVAGIAAVCIEDTAASKEMRSKYKLSSCVVPGSAIQQQCDRQELDSFKEFRAEDCFPDIGKA
jgi:adenine phosphoribosyltransferase